jgi:hypothetical protein
MDTRGLVSLLVLLAFIVCFLVPVGFWFRNRRTIGPVTFVTWPPFFRAAFLTMAVLNITVPIFGIAATGSLMGGLLFAVMPLVYGTLFALTPWRWTERGLLSLSGFWTWDRIESFRWWGRNQLTSQLTIYPKRGASRFSSLTTTVLLAQQDAVDILLRQHTQPS